MTNQTTFSRLQEQIEYAPAASTVRVNPDLHGWTIPIPADEGGTLQVCATCAARILARGFGLPSGTFPLWHDDDGPSITCELCEETTAPSPRTTEN